MPTKAKRTLVPVATLTRLERLAAKGKILERWGSAVGMDPTKDYLRHCVVSGSEKSGTGTLVVAFDVEDGKVTWPRNADFVSAAHGDEARYNDALDGIYDAIEEQASDHMQDEEEDENEGDE